MKSLINKGRRRLGIPGRPAIILNPDESKEITDEQERELIRNRTVSRWLEAGVLVITGAQDKPAKTSNVKPKRPNPPPTRKREHDERKVEPLPDGVSGEGVEIQHLGGGWYQVFVSGFKVTDRNVRKDEAKSIASEYE